MISSLSATVKSQWRTIRALEELAAVTAAQAECCASAPPRELQTSLPTIYESDLWHVEEGSSDFCNIEINRSAWTGRLIVTGDHQEYGYSWYHQHALWVDGVRGACTSVRGKNDDSDLDWNFCQAQVAQERVPEHSITWSTLSYYLGYGWKICQGPLLDDSSVAQPDVDVRPVPSRAVGVLGEDSTHAIP